MQKHKELAKIFDKFDIGILNEPSIYPNIENKVKENIVKNVDNSILLDSLVACYQTNILNKSCKEGLFFTLAGIYISEMLEKVVYVNYSDINSVSVTPDKKGMKNTANACTVLHLKNNSTVKIPNYSIKYKDNLANLIKELVEFNKTWNSSAYEKNSGTVDKTPLPPDIKKKCKLIIHSASVACGGVGTGLAQIPLSDTAIITPIQIGMIISLATVFGLKITREFANSLLKSFAAAITGRAVSQVLVGWIPVLGNAINTATAAGITEAIGWSVVNGFYQQEQENKAKYALEGQRKGYIYASAEYENKLHLQAQLFETQERNFRKEAESFEQLLNDYETYINKLEGKKDLSQSDKSSLTNIQAEYEKLKKLKDE